MYFSENLIKLRKGKGWSQEDLADKLDISRQAVSKWEVGTSKPDIDNLMKLSKLFSKPIDELVNNKIVHTEAMSIAVKKRDFKHDLLLWLRGLIVLLIVLLVIDTIYKFTMLFIITMGEQKYKELDNYHYVVTKYDENGIKEKEEGWYKEGVSKTINNVYVDGNPEEMIIYLDSNKNIGYIDYKTYNLKQEIDIEKEYNLYKEKITGESIFSNIPEEIRKMDISYILNKVFTSSQIKIDANADKIFLTLDNKYITINKGTLIPTSMIYLEEKDEKFLAINYIIEINSVKNIEI